MRRQLPRSSVVTLALLSACGGGTSHARSPAPSTAPPASVSTTTAATPVATLPITPPPVAAPAVTTRRLAGSATTPAPYKWSVDIPVLGRSALHAAAINATIAGDAQHAIDDFAAQVQAYGPASSAGPTDPSATSDLECTSDTRLVDVAVVSFRSPCSSYMAGAAHPIESVSTWNFDLASGRRLALADLFAAGSGYLDFLSRGAIVQLDRQFHDDTAAGGGAGPQAENFAAWTMTTGEFEVTFGDGQVGPHAIGTPTVVFTYRELRPYLRADGPLAHR